MTDNEHDPQSVRVTPPVVTCPNCGRAAPWTDGRSKVAGDEVDEVWCQTCSYEFPVPDPTGPLIDFEPLVDPPPPGLADRSLAAIFASRTPQADSAGVTAAHLTARRAVEDMAAAHREQLAGARAATRKAADEADRWRAEAEAARAQVGTLTAKVLKGPDYFPPDVAGVLGLAPPIAREALGPAREETT